MKNHIKFSIVSPTFNRHTSGLLQQCVESIISQQTNDNFTYEHIIINDGSSDGTHEYLTELAKKDSKVVYIQQENRGVAKAVKAGVEAATGDYVTVIGDDDMLPPDSLKKRYEYILEHQDVDWFYADADWIDDYGLPTKPLFQSKWYDDFQYERMLVSPYMHSGTLTCKRKSIQDIEWPEWINRSEDYFFWLELLRPERKLKFDYLTEVVFLYRYHASGYTSQLDSPEKLRAKRELNLKIKSLHPASLVFLAEQAYEFSRGTDYMRGLLENGPQAQELANLRTRAKALEDEMNGYHSSRYIGPIIKARKLKARGKRFARKYGGRIKHVMNNKLRGNTEHSVQKVHVKTWHDNDPLISIVTPFYNRTETLPETIRSVLGQTFQNFEYLIINDGSSAPEAIEYLAKIKHPKIRIINQDNQGVAVARNTGVKNARGKYVMCLDDDDIINPTFIEKALISLEMNPDISIVTYDMQMFGDRTEIYNFPDYDPLTLVENNTVLTASVFRKQAWEAAGGYKSDIGYEDWEFWVSAAEKGHFAKRIPETLLRYRTSIQSRYIDDQEHHEQHSELIKKLHPNYYKSVAAHIAQKSNVEHVIDKGELFTNLGDKNHYKQPPRPHVLIAVPWLPFGGAEMYTLNFTSQLKDKYDFSIVTGVKDDHAWDHKFQEVTQNIFHLANIFDPSDHDSYYDFIRNYIKTRSVDVLHIVHSGYVFPMLATLKQEFPTLKILVTMFNARVPEYVSGVRSNTDIIDYLISDNKQALQGITEGGAHKLTSSVISNGIDAGLSYNPDSFDRSATRSMLRLTEKDIAVGFIGRLSEEKNPDVFVQVAENIIASKDSTKGRIKFFIAGDGPMRTQIEEQIATVKSPRIEYLGYKQPDEVKQILSALDIVVLPSKIEGFPVALAEAMSMAVVPIASRVGGIPDVVSDAKNGYTVAAGAVDEIVGHIRTLSANPELMSQLKKAARQTIIDKHTSEKMRDQYNDIYEKVTKGSDAHDKS